MADKLDLYHSMDNYYLGEYTQEFKCINIVSDLGVLPQALLGVLCNTESTNVSPF